MESPRASGPDGAVCAKQDVRFTACSGAGDTDRSKAVMALRYRNAGVCGAPLRRGAHTWGGRSKGRQTWEALHRVNVGAQPGPASLLEWGSNKLISKSRS